MTYQLGDPTITLTGELAITLPKGENGQQSPAFFYRYPGDFPFALDKFQVIEGIPLSYNNFTDIDRLLTTMRAVQAALKQNKFPEESVALTVKHGNPCGSSFSINILDGQRSATRRTVTGDTRAAFGGITMCNFAIDEYLAKTMVTAGMSEETTQKFDSVIAHDFTPKAIEILSRKGHRCRLVKTPRPLQELLYGQGYKKREAEGGLLIQPHNPFILDFNHPDLKVFGRRIAAYEWNLLLAWAVGSTSNSNTITIVNNEMVLGNGVGQQDRVGAAELAIKRAIDAGHESDLAGAVAYSDSFFPYPDAVQRLIDAGIKAIFSTSGSVNDKLTQDLCIERGVTLYQRKDSEARGFFGH